MEISPITGICSQLAVRPKETFLGLPGIFEVENSPRADDETDSSPDSKSDSRYEDDEFTQEEDSSQEGEQESEQESEDESEADPGTASDTLAEESSPVSYFA